MDVPATGGFAGGPGGTATGDSERRTPGDLVDIQCSDLIGRLGLVWFGSLPPTAALSDVWCVLVGWLVGDDNPIEGRTRRTSFVL